MKKLPFWFLLLIPWLAFSQEIPKERTWIVKFNPVQAIDVINFPTIAFGVEKKITPYFSVNA